MGLIGLYAGAAFRSGAYRVRALAIFSVVYALIYLLMRLEDFALLAGSVASFIGLALAMFLTRNIDWYGGRATPAEAAAAPAPTSARRAGAGHAAPPGFRRGGLPRAPPANRSPIT